MLMVVISRQSTPQLFFAQCSQQKLIVEEWRSGNEASSDDS